MAIAKDSHATSHPYDFSSWSFSNYGGSGLAPYCAVLCFCTRHTGLAGFSATYGGQAMTRRQYYDSTNDQSTGIYTLDNAPSGTQTCAGSGGYTDMDGWLTLILFSRAIYKASSLGNNTSAVTFTTKSGDAVAASIMSSGYSYVTGGTELHDLWYADGYDGTHGYILATGTSTSYSLSGNASRLAGVHLEQVSSPGTALWWASKRWKGLLRDIRQGLVPPDELRRRYRDLVAGPGVLRPGLAGV